MTLHFTAATLMYEAWNIGYDMVTGAAVDESSIQDSYSQIFLQNWTPIMGVNASKAKEANGPFAPFYESLADFIEESY